MGNDLSPAGIPLCAPGATRLMTTAAGREKLQSGASLFEVSSKAHLPELSRIPSWDRDRLLAAVGRDAVIWGARLYATATRPPSPPAADIEPSQLEAGRAQFLDDASPASRRFDAFVTELGDESFVEMVSHLANRALSDVLRMIPPSEDAQARIFEITCEHVVAGIRNEVLLAHLQDEDAFLTLVHRFAEVAWADTLLGRQAGADALTSSERVLAGAMAHAQPDNGDRTAASRAAIKSSIRSGARLARALLGPARNAHAISLNESALARLWMAATGNGEPHAAALRAVSRPEFFRALSLEAEQLVLRLPPTSSGCRPVEVTHAAVQELLFNAALLEAALVCSAAEAAETAEVRASVDNHTTVRLPPSALPWPSDGLCDCGRSLQDFLFCCGGQTSITLEEARAVRTSMKRRCCGDRFYGFRCDACGRLYAWAARRSDDDVGSGGG